MNNIMSMLSGMASAGANNSSGILMQAFAAMMSGQSAESFMKGLAKNTPALQGIDLDNLEKSAKTICKQKGENFTEAKRKTQKVMREMSSKKG